MLFFTAILTFPGDALAAPNLHLSFQEWLSDAAEDEDLRIVRWGLVDRDQDGTADYAIAELCDTRPTGTSNSTDSPWRVYEANGRRWVVERHGSRPCTTIPATTATFGPVDRHFASISVGGARHQTEYFLEPVDGDLEITLFRSADIGGWSPGSRIEDWIHRTAVQTWTEWRYGTHTLPSGEVEDATEVFHHTNEAAIIIVASNSTERSTVNRVLSGMETFTGPDDATLSVLAVERIADHVDVVIRITDDIVTTKDQLELWWCLHKDDCSRESGAIRHLRIPLSSTGVPAELHQFGDSQKELKPTVLREIDGATTVRFPHDAIIHPERRVLAEGLTLRHIPSGADRLSGWSTPFTVLFLDADSPTETPTRIATSDFDANEPLSFGLLARYPSNHSFPTHAGHVLRDIIGITAIRMLGPREKRIRSSQPIQVQGGKMGSAGK